MVHVSVRRSGNGRLGSGNKSGKSYCQKHSQEKNKKNHTDNLLFTTTGILIHFFAEVKIPISGD
jgi:hypothetical protein